MQEYPGRDLHIIERSGFPEMTNRKGGILWREEKSSMRIEKQFR